MSYVLVISCKNIKLVVALSKLSDTLYRYNAALQACFDPHDSGLSLSSFRALYHSTLSLISLRLSVKVFVYRESLPSWR